MPDNHGQFVLVQAPAALPGKCTGCGKATDARGFIDTGYDADFWGVIYYCYECVLDMSTKFGFIGPETAETMLVKIAELEKETSNQRAAILGLEHTVDGLLQVRDSGISDLTVPVQPDTIDEPEVTEPSAETIAAEESSFIFEGTEFNAESGNPEINDVISESGSAGISDSDGLASWAELSV